MVPLIHFSHNHNDMISLLRTRQELLNWLIMLIKPIIYWLYSPEICGCFTFSSWIEMIFKTWIQFTNILKFSSIHLGIWKPAIKIKLLYLVQNERINSGLIQFMNLNMSNTVYDHLNNIHALGRAWTQTCPFPY